MARLLLIPLALLLMLAGAMAWSGSASLGRADFVFVNRGDIITLDPNQMSYLQDMRIAYAMREGLYTYDPITLQPIPGVALSDTVSDDKRTWVFHLRPNARWSNGDPVTSADFVFAWRRMLESPGEYSYLFYYIKGAADYLTAYAEGQTPDWSTVGIEAPDPLTLKVTLTDPVVFFRDLVAFPPFLPLHKPSMEPFKLVDETTGRTRYDQRFTRPPHVVSNGPFILTQWDFKTRLRLMKNEQYWDHENVRSNSIEMSVVEDPLTQLLRYESGSVDWIAAVPTEVAVELKLKGRPDLRSFSGFGTTYLTYMCRPQLNNGRPNPLADERIRWALSMVIDKQQIIDTITRMGEEPASTYVPKNVFPDYRPQPGIPYDPERARRLLAEAGYPSGGTLPGVTYLYAAELATSKEMAQLLARQWKQKLNLDIPLESAELKIRRQRANDRDFTIIAGNWIGDYADPSTFTDKYRSTSENNDSVWKNPQYDALVFQAAKEPNPEARLRLLEQAERILLQETPIFPLYYLTNQYLFRDEVKGINTHPRNMTMFKGVYVER